LAKTPTKRGPFAHAPRSFATICQRESLLITRPELSQTKTPIQSEGERERRERDIRLRALCTPRPHTVGYVGGCDQEQGVMDCLCLSPSLSTRGPFAHAPRSFATHTPSSLLISSLLHSRVNLEWCDKIKLSNLIKSSSQTYLKMLTILSSSGAREATRGREGAGRAGR